MRTWLVLVVWFVMSVPLGVLTGKWLGKGRREMEGLDMGALRPAGRARPLRGDWKKCVACGHSIWDSIDERCFGCGHGPGEGCSIHCLGPVHSFHREEER